MSVIAHWDSLKRQGSRDGSYHSLSQQIQALWESNFNPKSCSDSTVIIRRVIDGHESKFRVSERVWCIVCNTTVSGVRQIYIGTQTLIIELLDPFAMIVFIWILEHGAPEVGLPFRFITETLGEVEDLIVCYGQQRDVLPHLSVYYQQEISEQGVRDIRHLANASMAAFWKGDHDAFERATRLYIKRLRLHERQLDNKGNEVIPVLIQDQIITKVNALKRQMVHQLKTRIQALGRDLSFFELLSSSGQCHQAFRQNYFQKHISEPAEQVLNSLCVQDFQAALHLTCDNVIKSHRCTASMHCPLRLNTWYLLKEVNNICESSTGICFYEFEFGDIAEQCSRCRSVA